MVCYNVVWESPSKDASGHLAQRTVISGKVTDGKLVSWKIEPASRKKDVIVYEPQARLTVFPTSLPQDKETGS